MNPNSATQRPVTYITQGRPLQVALFSFIAAVSGTAVGFIAAVAVVMPAVHKDLASQTKQLSSSLASSMEEYGSTNDTAACYAPMEGNGQGMVGGRATYNMPSAGGMGGGPNGGNQGGGQTGGQGGTTINKTYITKLLGGATVHTTSSINNTGPYSKNIIDNDTKTTTTINNTNDISLSNNNTQAASSGTATVKDNTSAGSALTGDATNVNSASLNIRVTNN